MPADISKPNWLYRIASIVLLALAIGCGLMVWPMEISAAVLAIVTIISFIIMPQVIMSILLIVRSSLDVFTNVGFKMGPMLFNVPSIISILILLGGGTYVLTRSVIKKDIALGRVGRVFLLWILALIFWVILAYFNFGIDGLLGLREWVRLASLFIIYVLVYWLAQNIGYEYIINCLFFALPVPVIAALYQFVTRTGIKVGPIMRVQGTCNHPSALALMLVLFIGLTLWKIRTSRKRILWYLLAALECFVLIITFGITGMIMLAIMLLILGLNTFSIKHRFIIFVLIIAAIISFSFSHYGKHRLEEVSRTGDIYNIIETGRITEGGSFAWRILNWTLFIKEWNARPILGYGLHTTGEIVAPLSNIPHNDYLRFLVETGIVGIFLYLYLLSVLGMTIWSIYRGYIVIDNRFSYLALVNFSIFIAWAVGSSADNYITITVFQYYFWALTGAVLGNAQRHSLQVS